MTPNYAFERAVTALSDIRWCLVLLSALMLASCTTRELQRDPLARETEVRQSRPRITGEQFDPQEIDPALQRIFAAADLEAERSVANVERHDRFIFDFWAAKKRILRERYQVDWKTPAELSPLIEYASYGQPAVTEAEIRSIEPLLRAHMHSDKETVSLYRRTYEGLVEVFARDPTAGLARVYQFNGHDETWAYIDDYVLEE